MLYKNTDVASVLAQAQAAAVEAAQRRELQATVAAKAAQAAEERRLAAIVANTRATMAQAAQQQLAAEKRAYAEAQAAAERYAAQQRAQAAEAAARAKADAAYRAAVLATQDSRDRFARQAAQRQVAAAPVQLPAPAGAQLSAISGQLALIHKATLALVGAQTLGELVRMVDTYSQLAARLKLVTTSTQAATQAQQQLFAIAQRNGIALNDAAGLFLRIAQPMREMGANQAQVLAVTEAVGQSLRISGSNAQESSAAMQQFSQALGAGVLNGDELRSILESAPRLAQAVADGLGVPIGKLKELGEQGSLSSQKVLQALQTQIPLLRKEAEQIPLTIGAAITQVQNAFAQYVGAADSAAGSSRRIAEALGWVAQNIDTVVSAAAGLAADRAGSGRLRRAHRAGAGRLGLDRQHAAQTSRRNPARAGLVADHGWRARQRDRPAAARARHARRGVQAHGLQHPDRQHRRPREEPRPPGHGAKE